MTKQDRWRALACVRAVLRGWAFAPDDWLPRKVAMAEEELSGLPDELRAEGEELIAPVRRRRDEVCN